jgi:hypothetical protein
MLIIVKCREKGHQWLLPLPPTRTSSKLPWLGTIKTFDNCYLIQPNKSINKLVLVALVDNGKANAVMSPVFVLDLDG